MPIELQKVLPTGFRFRELWLPGLANNNATLPPSVNGGRALTLTGAQGRTTADGIRGTAAATSMMNCGALYNAAGTFWCSLRFRLQAQHAAGSPDKGIWYKRPSGNDYLRLYLDTVTGSLRLEKLTATVQIFNIGTVKTTWAANTWFHVVFSNSAANGIRLIAENAAAVTNADVTALPAAGNVEVGGAAGFAVGLIGDYADVVMGNDDLTAAEEADLYNGIAPADAVNLYRCDEGMGLTAYDRGSGGNNATLGATQTWQFGGCKQPILSLDGINDVAQSAAGVNINGDLTLVWVGKMKSTYSSLAAAKRIFHVQVDGNNLIALQYDSGTNVIRAVALGGGTLGQVLETSAPVIDEYRVYALVHSGSDLLFYRNGQAIGTAALPVISSASATAYLGSTGASEYDVSKPLLAGIVDGAMSAGQVRAFSRLLDQRLGMGIGI